MSLVGVAGEPRSMVCRAAAADALITAGVLVLCVISAFTFDLATWAGGLIPAFVLGSVPLALVTALDVMAWRRLSTSRFPSQPRRSAAEATGLAAAGLPLLLFGTVVTAIEVGVGGVKNSDFAEWTSTAVGDLLLVGLGTQVVLLVLTLLLRRRFPAADRVSAPS